MNAKPRLPPLRTTSSSGPEEVAVSTPTKQENTVRESATEKWQRLQNSNQASSLTPREKNRFISELMATCRLYEKENGVLSEELRTVKTRLSHSESLRDDLTKSLREQQSVTRTYEHFTFVPPNLDVGSLTQSVAELENDIRSFELVTDTPQSLDRQALSLDPTGRVWQTLELKFKRLEQLIVVLKKRILKFEDNVHLAAVVKEYGDLDSLLQDNQRLKDENTKLRSREARFKTDPLLNRYVGTSDSTFLRVLSMALQNELSYSRRLLDRYNIVANPSLQLLVVPPEPLPPVPSLAVLDSWLADVTLKNDFVQELDAFRARNEAGLQHDLRDLTAEIPSIDLLQRVNSLENTVKLQEEQIIRLQMERNMKANVGMMKEYCDKELQHPLKGLSKKQFQDLNEKLIDELKVLQDRLAKQEQTITLQEQTRLDALHEKERFLEENLIVNRRVLQLLAQNKRLNSRLESATKLSHALYISNLSSIAAILEHKLPKDKIPYAREHFHSRLIPAFFEYTSAATKIQSWVRGLKVRQKSRLRLTHLVNYVRPTPLTVVEEAEAPHLEVTGDGQIGYLPEMRVLAEIIMSAERDTRALLQVPSVLSMAKNEIYRQLRPQLQADLANLRQYMNDATAELTETVAHALQPPERRDFASQAAFAGVDVEIQTDDATGLEDDRGKRRKKDSTGKSRPGSASSKSRDKGKHK